MNGNNDNDSETSDVRADGNSGAQPDWLLLEDGPLLAVNKPAGILTEGAPAPAPSLVDEVKAWLRDRSGKAGNVYLGIPHRLDRSTSGVIVFTKNSKAAARVARQFEERQVTKIYWALLEQAPATPAGMMIDWLRRIPDESRSEVVPPGTSGAKEAQLRYRALGEVGGLFLVEVHLLTGRMHQIRAQFGSRGCPLAGDVRYGGGVWKPAADGEKTTVPAGAIALHARALDLLHPIRYDSIHLEAPVPDYWPTAVPSLLKGGPVEVPSPLRGEG